MATSPQKSPSVPKSPTPKSPPSRKKDDSFLGKLGGTLARRKKAKEGFSLGSWRRPALPASWSLRSSSPSLTLTEFGPGVAPLSRFLLKLLPLLSSVSCSAPSPKPHLFIGDSHVSQVQPWSKCNFPLSLGCVTGSQTPQTTDGICSSCLQFVSTFPSSTRHPQLEYVRRYFRG